MQMASQPWLTLFSLHRKFSRTIKPLSGHWKRFQPPNNEAELQEIVEMRRRFESLRAKCLTQIGSTCVGHAHLSEVLEKGYTFQFA